MSARYRQILRLPNQAIYKYCGELSTHPAWREQEFLKIGHVQDYQILCPLTEQLSGKLIFPTIFNPFEIDIYSYIAYWFTSAHKESRKKVKVRET